MIEYFSPQFFHRKEHEFKEVSQLFTAENMSLRRYRREN